MLQESTTKSRSSGNFEVGVSAGIVLDFKRRVKRGFIRFFWACRHLLPSAMLLRGRIFLVARFRLVFFHSNLGAHGLRSWGSHFLNHSLTMDPFFPEFWCGATCPWRIWWCDLIQIFTLSVEEMCSDGNLETHNPIVQTPFSKAPDPFTPLFFDFLLGCPSNLSVLGIGIFRHICTLIQPCNGDTRERANNYMTGSYTLSQRKCRHAISASLFQKDFLLCGLNL